MFLNIFKLVTYSLSLFLLFCTAWLMDQRTGGEPLDFRGMVIFSFIVLMAVISIIQLDKAIYYFIDIRFMVSRAWPDKCKNIWALNVVLLWMLFIMSVTYLLTK